MKLVTVVAVALVGRLVTAEVVELANRPGLTVITEHSVREALVVVTAVATALTVATGHRTTQVVHLAVTLEVQLLLQQAQLLTFTAVPLPTTYKATVTHLTLLRNFNR